MNKKDLSDRDICYKFIGPAVKRAGWGGMMQVREEVAFTKGRIIVRGKLVTRGKAKRADYILYYKPNIPIAIIEAKDNNHSVGDGMQQAVVRQIVVHHIKRISFSLAEVLRFGIAC
jgi:type I restriction enzyme R subunit